jgi:hypothetical protein
MTPEPLPIPRPTACAEPGCERPAVVAAERCRVHLAETDRLGREMIAPDDPEHAGMFAAASHIVRTALADLSPDLLSPSAPQTQFDLYAVLAREARFDVGYRALDLLATMLADRFGAMRLSRPSAYQSEVMLHARTAGPAADAFRAQAEFALRAMMLEFLGPDVSVATAVVPAQRTGPVVAVIQAFFPVGVDRARFANGFGTRDYFRWQLELGERPGVGLVRSEPCTVLMADEEDGGLLPPNLMISFTVLGDLEPIVRDVVEDLKRRLVAATQPEHITVGVSLTLEHTTPEAVRREIDSWRARGYELLDHDEGALVAPMEGTVLLFEFPASSLGGSR